MKRLAIFVGLKIVEIGLVMSLAFPGNWLANRYAFPEVIGEINSWATYGQSLLAMVIWLIACFGIGVIMIGIVGGLYYGVVANWDLAGRIKRGK